MRIMMIVFTLLIGLVFLWMLRAAKTRLNAFGLALIIGGALGNVIDRVLRGAVVDFISLHHNDYYWYVFNLADVWITVGCGLVLIDSLRQNDKAIDK